MKKQSMVLTFILFLSLLLMPDCSKAEININDENLYKSLRGKIILRVESKGEAYYVHPTKQKMFYLGRPADAFQVMREQGIGITNTNLAKILPDVGAADQEQSDGDFLKDSIEDALGSDKYKDDTDNDGYDDRQEILSGNNPLGSGKLNLDNSFANEQMGKIFLQVENKGEAWYVNPSDTKRYFLGRPTDAFYLMRNLGLGISEDNYNKLSNTSSVWKNYSNKDFGIELKYPNDNTYSIETPDENKIIFSQEHPGNRFHISKSTDNTITSTDKKIINSVEYTMFKREGMGDSYGYIAKQNENYFTFESSWGPKNDTFEILMNSVKFIK